MVKGPAYVLTPKAYIIHNPKQLFKTKSYKDFFLLQCRLNENTDL